MNNDQFDNDPNEMTDDELIKWAAEKATFNYKGYIIFFCIMISFMASIYYII